MRTLFEIVERATIPVTMRKGAPATLRSTNAHRYHLLNAERAELWSGIMADTDAAALAQRNKITITEA